MFDLNVSSYVFECNEVRYVFQHEWMVFNTLFIRNAHVARAVLLVSRKNREKFLLKYFALSNVDGAYGRRWIYLWEPSWDYTQGTFSRLCFEAITRINFIIKRTLL